MPSEQPEILGPDPELRPSAVERPPWWDVLFSQGLGVICGQGVVLLLGVGSVVIAATREGASAALRMDSLRPFFESPSLTHLWFYLLLPVFGLYALNTLLCTWRSTAARWRAGRRSPFHHGPAFLHVALLVALVAHGVGGLWSVEHPPMLLDHQWRPIGDGREVRVTDLRFAQHPNGQLRQVHARLAVRHHGRASAPVEVRFNGPLFSSDLIRVHLLAQFDRQPGVVLQAGAKRCHLGVGGHCTVDGHRLHLVGVVPAGHVGKHPVARLVVVPPGPGTPRRAFVLPNRPLQLSSGTTVRFSRLAPLPRVLLRVRDNPGVPWALGASVLLLLGLVFMGRRWLR